MHAITTTGKEALKLKDVRDGCTGGFVETKGKRGKVVISKKRKVRGNLPARSRLKPLLVPYEQSRKSCQWEGPEQKAMETEVTSCGMTVLSYNQA